MLIAYNINSEHEQQNFLFQTYFYSLVVRQVFRIPTMSKALIQTAVFRNNQNYV